VGSSGDGGYVIMGDQHYTGLVSLGISDNNDFEVDLNADYTEQYDYSIDKPPKDVKNSNFYKTMVKTNDDLVLDFEKLGEHIFLKMDIEGSEWGLIPTMNLTKFEQICIEFHFLDGSVTFKRDKDECFEFIYDPLKKNTLQHILKTHTITHVHGNNYSGLLNILNDKNYIQNFPIVIEVTFIRNDTTDFFLKKTQYPTEHDAPNFSKLPDLDLRMWPFEINVQK